MRDWAVRILRKHIEPRIYAGLWLLALGLVGLIVWYSVAEYGDNMARISVVAAALAVVFATIGWIWNGRVQLDMIRRTNAMLLLSRLQDPMVNAWKDVVYAYIVAYNKFESEKKWRKPRTPKAEIEKLLGLYEQIAVAVLNGAVHEKIIRDSQDLIFKRIYCGLYHHIQLLQQIDKRYFCSFEGVACRWHPDLEKHAAEKHPAGSLFDPLREF